MEVGSQFYKMLEVGRQVCKKLEAAGQIFKKLEVRDQNVAYLVAQMHHLIFIDWFYSNVWPVRKMTDTIEKLYDSDLMSKNVISIIIASANL